MARKAMTQSSDSQNPPALSIRPRSERKFTLTKLGFEACRYFDEQDEKQQQPLDDKRGIDTAWLDDDPDGLPF